MESTSGTRGGDAKPSTQGWGRASNSMSQETGDRAGRPVLFIHGVSQCRLAWNRQLRSDLGNDLRLVAVDLRGHGLSDRPYAEYGEPRLWADDIQAVITTLGLERPILCGWSYGGVVIGDYIRCYGEQELGGICLVGAASRLGEPVMPFLGAGIRRRAARACSPMTPR